MNRHDRRAQAAQNRKQLDDLRSGVRWKQRTDPDDPRYALVEMRFPTNGMPDAEYSGADAVDRITLGHACLDLNLARAVRSRVPAATITSELPSSHSHRAPIDEWLDKGDVGQ